MEIQNINTFLKNEETRELGAMMAVSQGLERKFLALYEAKMLSKYYKNISTKTKVHYVLNSYSLNIALFNKKKHKQTKKNIRKYDCSKYLNILVCIRDAMHDKEVYELVQAGKMKESDRLPF